MLHMHLDAAMRAWVKSNVFVPVKRVSASYEVKRYLSRTTTPRINIGAGGNRIRGWLNLDLYPAPGVVYMDASLRWPFADASIDAILCEHMIEHVPKSLGVHLLHEMSRILQPGGWVRIVTPDLNWLASRILNPSSTRQEESYLEFLNTFMKRKSTSWCDAVNLCFYEHGHRYIWSIEELQSQLMAAGFSELTITRAACPVQQVFAGTEGHPKMIGVENDAIEAFAIEARG